jgi:Transposase, Mutator family
LLRWRCADVDTDVRWVPQGSTVTEPVLKRSSIRPQARGLEIRWVEVRVTSAEDRTGWLAFCRDLTARGLSGTRLVASDTNRGLVVSTPPENDAARRSTAGRPLPG